MNTDILIYIGTSIAVIGTIAAIISGILSYRNVKKADKEGKFKDYLLKEPLTNTDYSIQKAVKNLKIVNSSWDICDIKDKNEQL